MIAGGKLFINDPVIIEGDIARRANHCEINDIEYWSASNAEKGEPVQILPINAVIQIQDDSKASVMGDEGPMLIGVDMARGNDVTVHAEAKLENSEWVISLNPAKGG